MFILKNQPLLDDILLSEINSIDRLQTLFSTKISEFKNLTRQRIFNFKGTDFLCRNYYIFYFQRFK